MSDFSFDPKAIQYQPKHAYWLARSAALVYDTVDKVEAVIRDWGLPQFRFFDNDGTQCFLAGNDEMLILCFRGTEADKIRDIASDAEALQTEGPWGKAHRGFSRALDQVWDEIVPAIQEMRQNGQSLWICGHSLGAALATMCAARLAKSGTEINGIYTYGQPRVGDPVFSDEYDKALRPRHYRFVNNNDIVTRVPLPKVEVRSIKIEYGHVGTLIYITSSGSLSTSHSMWDRVLGWFTSAFSRKFTDHLDDHKMTGYVAALEKNLNTSPF